MSMTGLPRRARIAALCAGFCAALPAAAEIDSAALLGHYTLPDGGRAADAGFGGSLLMSIPLTPRVHLEPNLFAETINRGSGHDDVVGGLGFDVRYSFVLKRIEPFLLMGAGAEYDNPASTANGATVAPAVDVGAGVLVPLLRGLSLRADVRDSLVFNGSSYPDHDSLSDVRLRAGVQYSFGAAHPAGFMEREHADPDVPPVACCEVVDTKPAPAGSPTPLCPDAPTGFNVDADGCLIAQTVTLPSVRFASNTNALTPESRAVLDLLADALIQEPEVSVEVGGHTDASGAQAANLALSQQRAAAVADYLVGHGVSAARVRAEGYGSFKPVASNKTPQGRAQNRRVEFTLSRG